VQPHDPELPPYSLDADPVNIQDIERELHELHDDDFLFPFEHSPARSVEETLGSSRSGHPAGEMAGTETTIFDIDRQKVLLDDRKVLRTPGLGFPSRH